MASSFESSATDSEFDSRSESLPESSGSDSDLRPRARTPPAAFSDDEMDIDVPPSFQQPNTNPLVTQVRNALQSIEAAGLTLSELLDAVTWGSHACRADPLIRGACRAFMHSDTLESMLRRWARPPSTSKGRRPEGGSAAVKSAALLIVQDELLAELKDISARVLRSKADQHLSADELTSIRFEDIIPRVQTLAPLTWKLLRSLAYSQRQERHNTR